MATYFLLTLQNIAAYWFRQAVWLMDFVSFIWISVTQTKSCVGEWLITVYRGLHHCFCCLNATHLLMAVKWISMSSEWLSDLCSLTTSQLLHSRWSTPYKKLREIPIPIHTDIMTVTSSESRLNENWPSVAQCITEHTRNEEWKKKEEKKINFCLFVQTDLL